MEATSEEVRLIRGGQSAYRTRLDVVPALGPMVVMTGISEVGTDLTAWPTERHFASWLSICPNRKITGGKVKSSRTRKNTNRFAGHAAHSRLHPWA